MSDVDKDETTLLLPCRKKIGFKRYTGRNNSYRGSRDEAGGHIGYHQRDIVVSTVTLESTVVTTVTHRDRTVTMPSHGQTVAKSSCLGYRQSLNSYHDETGGLPVVTMVMLDRVATCDFTFERYLF